jgi:hypothetical protein
MKRALLSFMLFCLVNLLFAQNVYTIKADSVKITNCDSSELILENHTQNVPGFLFNTGNGRTIFKRAVQRLNDSIYLIGADSLKVRTDAWVQGGNSFGTAGILGTLDSNILYLFQNGESRMQFYNSGNVGVNTFSDPGFKFTVGGTTHLINLLTATEGAIFMDPLSFDGDSNQNIIYSNHLTFNTNNSLGNSQDGVFNFTNSQPAANSGAGHYRLIHVNKLVNRGDVTAGHEGEETAIRIDFTVTDSAGDLRAIHAATGNVIVETGNLLIGSATGSTSKLDITGANGYNQLRLRTQYTPSATSDPNGHTGDIAADDNYFYYKTSTGWKRAALSTF